jgi:hypothetical protein
MEIFTIACAKFDQDEGFARFRTWGWYPTLDEAREHVETGDDLLFEDDTYDYAVIEEIPVGAPVLAESAHWFRKVKGEDRAEPCAPPSWAEGGINYTMG